MALFQVSIGEDRYCFTLSEELERREVLDPEKLAAARYAWQRVPSSVQRVPSGRLVLRLQDGNRSPSSGRTGAGGRSPASCRRSLRTSPGGQRPRPGARRQAKVGAGGGRRGRRPCRGPGRPASRS